MSTKTIIPELRISSYMNLEQAMAEVRAYLEAKKKTAAISLEGVGFSDNQLAMQGAFLDRMSDIAGRLGQVEPNSKIGPAGVFLKRLLRKLIGWYSRPAQEFDRTALEMLRQIRQDMLQQQQQITALQRKIAGAQAPSARSAFDAAASNMQPQDPAEFLRVTVSLFRSLIDAPGVRQALQQDKSELLQRVDELLSNVESEFASVSRVSDAAPAPHP